VRRFQLPPEDQDDLRHDLLVEFFTRLKDYDPHRGTITGFTAVVLRRAVSRIAARLNRERSLFTPLSLDTVCEVQTATAFGDTISEEDGYLASFGFHLNPIATLERQLTFDSALSHLPSEYLNLCAELLTGSPSQSAKLTSASRATVYRRVADLRLRLLVAGIGLDVSVRAARSGLPE
jgi:hypothetical protein